MCYSCNTDVEITAEIMVNFVFFLGLLATSVTFALFLIGKLVPDAQPLDGGVVFLTFALTVIIPAIYRIYKES